MTHNDKLAVVARDFESYFSDLDGFSIKKANKNYSSFTYLLENIVFNINRVAAKGESKPLIALRLALSLAGRSQALASQGEKIDPNFTTIFKNPFKYGLNALCATFKAFNPSYASA